MKKIFLALILTGLIFVSLPVRNFAQDETGEVIKLYLPESKAIPVSNPIRVAIGNPNIADITQVTKRELILTPKAVGSTTLIFWDNFGEQNYKVSVFAEDMQQAKERIDGLLKEFGFNEVYTKIQEEDSKVLLLGRVKTVKEKERIAAALGSLSAKTADLIEVLEEESIVEIDAQILELSRGASKSLGFTWPSSLNVREAGSAALTDTGTNWSTLFNVLKFRRATSSGADPFTLKLDALIQEGEARLLSRPHVRCQSGKQAHLTVGGEVPILTASMAGGSGIGSGTAGSSSVEYKEYGVIIDIKPIVDALNRIHLDLKIDIKELGEEVTTDFAVAYKFTKESASTNMILEDGQSVAIGGLIKKKSQESVRRVPFLSEIPLLGALFRQKTTYKGSDADNALLDTELLITLTPKIVSRDIPKSQLMRQEQAFQPTAISRREEGTRQTGLAAAPVSDIDKYAQIVKDKINSALPYPREALESGWQGRLKLRLHLNHKGEIEELAISESSGYKILDDNALNTAFHQAPYPPFPPQIESQDIWVTVPVEYKRD